jgi:hypothetical protein
MMFLTQQMDATNLGTTVGPNLLWNANTKPESVDYIVHSQKVNEIVAIIIESSDYFFPVN